MDWTVWTAFVAAAAVIGLIPGPGVATIVGHALGNGRRTALAAVLGATLGNAAAMLGSLSGAGLLLMQSATAFTVLKWAGAAYLVGIGLFTLRQAWRDGGTGTATAQHRAVTASSAFWGTALVTALNPKTIVFFVAFAPQFIDAGQPYWPQAAILLVTFCTVVTGTDALYALTAARAAKLLRQDRAVRALRYAGGGTLIAAGVATAAART